MGNETSQLTGLEIDEKAVEVTDYWTHSSASLYNDTVTSLSVFIGDSFVEGSLWTNHTPLEKMAKNLMLHRHPCILKYVSSWNKGSRHYLAVEFVKPLAHAISTQTPLQKCIGLYSVLKAIAFLHEKAFSSHNNICSASVYVTKDGSWKLGGLEYLCRYEDLTAEYLNKTKTHRYDKAIHPNEQTKVSDPKYLKSGAIDKYAFAILVQELLNSHSNNDDIPCLDDFKKFCKAEIQNNTSELPSFSSILEHPYFTHDFIIIYSFLTELALKSESEKNTFFTDLVDKLRAFPEEIVARQLGDLLLSRLVLLDETACKHLLPNILKPKTDDSEEDGSIFSIETFKQNIVPKLLHIFCVRDAQIRLLLLNHFKGYRSYFTKEQLQNLILPELLIGIKDTNDHLVSVTLLALADLVPILGAAVVIGGKRLKLFNDGRPNSIIPLPPAPSLERAPRLVQSPEISEERRSSTLETSSYVSQVLELPERLSPDGGEDVLLTESIQTTQEEEFENWSDWEPEENLQLEPILPDLTSNPSEPTTLTSTIPPRVEISTDITSLDIKNLQNQKVETTDFDYFMDMEPVIEKTNKFFIDDAEDAKSNLAMSAVEENPINEECWGDDLSWAEK